MQEQMDLLKDMVVTVHKGEKAEPIGLSNEALKLTRLSDSDDMELYVTTFKRMMVAYEVKEARWAFKLAPQLTGNARAGSVAPGTDQP